MKKRFEQRLILSSIVGMVLLNLPILFLFNTTEVFHGMPILWIWIILNWIAIILISYITIRNSRE